MSYQIKPLGLGEILDQAVTVLKTRFATLIGIASLMYIPLLLAQQILLIVIGPQLSPISPGQTPASAQLTPAMLQVFIVQGVFGVLWALIVAPVTTAATIHAISSEYLGRRVSAMDSMKAGFRVFPSLLLTSLLKSLFIAVGFLLCIIPGVYMVFRYWFATYVVVLEGTSGTAALRRSKELAAKEINTIFLLGLVVGAIAMGAGMVAAFIPVLALRALVTVAISATMFIFSNAASVALYISARCKTEDFDLLLLADSIGAEAPAPAQA